MANVQGRCKKCGLVYRWHGSPALGEAACARCLRPLTQTTRMARAQWLDETPRMRPSDGRGFLSLGDAREAATDLHEMIAEVGDALSRVGVAVHADASGHRVTVVATIGGRTCAIDVLRNDRSHVSDTLRATIGAAHIQAAESGGGGAASSSHGEWLRTARAWGVGGAVLGAALEAREREAARLLDA